MQRPVAPKSISRLVRDSFQNQVLHLSGIVTTKSKENIDIQQGVPWLVVLLKKLQHKFAAPSRLD